MFFFFHICGKVIVVMYMKKIIIFGGGSGLSQMLKGLKLFPIDITAVVSVSDNGGSTLRLRKDFKEGRPKKYSTEELEMAVALLSQHSYSEVVSLTGISKSTIVRARKTIKKGKRKKIKI